MRAYLVTGPVDDKIVIPQIGITCTVTPQTLTAFVGNCGQFRQWRGAACDVKIPERLGRIVAIRDDQTGELAVVRRPLWDLVCNTYQMTWSWPASA